MSILISQLANQKHGDFVMDFVRLGVQSCSEGSSHDLHVFFLACFHFDVPVANF